jgi:PilZ domain
MVDGNQNDRRSTKRIPFLKDAMVEGLGSRRISDLSVGGVYLESPVSFPVGTDIDIRFKINDADDHFVQVKARVVYIHEGVGMGLCFVDPSPEITDKIKKVIDHH